MKLTHKVTLFAFALSALSQATLAQTPGASSGGLSGKEVLDLDGAIARRSLEDQAGKNVPVAAPAAPTQAAPAPVEMRVVRTYAPPRTIEVIGVDASAVGGPVTMTATLRWAGSTIAVNVGTVLKGYRVTHIDQNGTDLVAVRGRKRLHIPRQSLDDLGRPDVTEVSVPVRRHVEDEAVSAPVAQRTPVAPAAHAGQVAQAAPAAPAAPAVVSGNQIALPKLVAPTGAPASTMPPYVPGTSPTPPGLVAAESR